MKRIFTDPSVVPCDILKGVLEGNGIPAIIRNERGSAGAGAGDPVPFMPSLAFAWPEVWVPDKDEETALAIVNDMKKEGSPSQEAWKCSRCGEVVDPELDVCWKCETPRPDEAANSGADPGSGLSP